MSFILMGIKSCEAGNLGMDGIGSALRKLISKILSLMAKSIKTIQSGTVLFRVLKKNGDTFLRQK